MPQMPLGMLCGPCNPDTGGHQEKEEGWVLGVAKTWKSPHSLASKSLLVPRAFRMVPLAQPPPAAMSRSPLKAAIDMDDATRLGSEAGGSPRSEFHTFFWVSVRQLWALEQPVGPSRRGQRGQRGQGLGWGNIPAGPGPLAQPPPSWQKRDGGKARVGSGRRVRWAHRVFGKLLGGWGHVCSLLPQPDPRSWDGLGSGGNWPGLRAFPTCPKWSEGPEPTHLASE